jgi:hypothetical protein
LPSSATTAAADVAEIAIISAAAIVSAIAGFLSSFAVIMVPSSVSLFDGYI